MGEQRPRCPFHRQRISIMLAFLLNRTSLRLSDMALSQAVFVYNCQYGSQSSQFFISIANMAISQIIVFVVHTGRHCFEGFVNEEGTDREFTKYMNVETS